MEKNYSYIESITSLCNVCEKRVEAKIIEKDGAIYIVKSCLQHGEQIEILEEDAEYHKRKNKYDKPGNKIFPETSVKKGCPFDCGLCPSHEQHTCNALIDVTEKCDLCCPMCYASSGKGKHLDLKTIEKMMDFFQLFSLGVIILFWIRGRNFKKQKR